MSAVADVRPALIGHLKELHLPTVRQCYEETARCAEPETLSYEQYLLQVISGECRISNGNADSFRRHCRSDSSRRSRTASSCMNETLATWVELPASILVGQEPKAR